ncbi:type II secretion system protein [Candidatus Nomurabacteria bacterium]|nr:type II secretion system protein [Candidatus Nomurabacteria bacterium]
MFKLSKTIKNNKQRLAHRQAGMTYVELIVVLGIFAVMSSIVMFNYGEFQAKIDIKNLASDIALKIVEAQKSSLSGKLSIPPPIISSWKPSYGIYFNSSLALDIDGIPFNKKFIYFADLDNANGYNIVTEKLDTISIMKGYFIDKIDRCTGTDCSPIVPISPLAITFKRPDSSVSFKDSTGTTLASGFDYIKITIKSPKASTAAIKIYPSGRIQVN